MEVPSPGIASTPRLLPAGVRPSYTAIATGFPLPANLATSLLNLRSQSFTLTPFPGSHKLTLPEAPLLCLGIDFLPEFDKALIKGHRAVQIGVSELCGKGE